MRLFTHGDRYGLESVGSTLFFRGYPDLALFPYVTTSVMSGFDAEFLRQLCRDRIIRVEAFVPFFGDQSKAKLVVTRLIDPRGSPRDPLPFKTYAVDLYRMVPVHPDDVAKLVEFLTVWGVTEAALVASGSWRRPGYSG